MKKINYIILFFTVLIFSGCGGSGSSSTSTSTIPYNVSLSASNLSNDNVYAVFTNTNVNSDTASNISITSNTVSSKSISMTYSSTTNDNEIPIYHDLPYEVKITPNTTKSLLSNSSVSSSTVNESIDTEETFIVHNLENDNIYENVTALLKKKVSSIETDYGQKTLNIWVEKSVWNDSKNLITSEMLDAVADKFLKSGSDNDIYDLDTNIYGEEWGEISNNYSFISETNEINILIYNFKKLSNEGEVIGYYSKKDGYSKKYVSQSNERIMFYMNSNFLSSKDITDEEPDMFISTLAHEFLHLIMFYQKNVLKSNMNDPETWLNEMCAMVTEDFVAGKLNLVGPREVALKDGEYDYSAGSRKYYNSPHRMNEFNVYNNIAANADSFVYGVGYAYGAFLARNFGGTNLFQNIVQSPYTGYDAIEYALAKSKKYNSLTFEDTLKYWGKAAVLSTDSDADITYKYNNGDSGFDANNGYTLGSINVSNYHNDFKYNDIGITKSMSKGSNVYYLLGSNLSGTQSWYLTIPEGVDYQIIVKNSDGTYDKTSTNYINNNAIITK